MDYTSGPYHVTIPAGMTNATFDVSITDDNILEVNEDFMLTIDPSSLSPNVTPGNPYQTTVTIVDNGCKQYLSYSYYKNCSDFLTN